MKGIIIYATKHGCTEKVAKLLQTKLTQVIKAVDVEKENPPDLSSFDTVILGGPIYIGKLHKPLAAYMQQNSETLKTKKLALFLCAGEQDPACREKLIAANFPEELYNRAILREVLGGELYWNKLDFMTKLILRMVKGIKEGYSRLSETKIDRFVKGVAEAQL